MHFPRFQPFVYLGEDGAPVFRIQTWIGPVVQRTSTIYVQLRHLTGTVTERMTSSSNARFSKCEAVSQLITNLMFMSVERLQYFQHGGETDVQLFIPHLHLKNDVVIINKNKQKCKSLYT